MRSLLFFLITGLPVTASAKSIVELGLKISPYCIITDAYEFAGFLSCIGHDAYARYRFSTKFGVLYSNSSFLRSEKSGESAIQIDTSFDSHGIGMLFYLSQRVHLMSILKQGAITKSRPRVKEEAIRKKGFGFGLEGSFTLNSTKTVSPEFTAGYLHFNAGNRSNFIYISLGLVFRPINPH